MSILNVNQIQPVGSGQTVTISAANINTESSTFNVGAGKSIRLYGATSGYSEIVAAAGSASTTFTLPANGGSASQYLQTDGSGVLSWATPAAGKIYHASQDVSGTGGYSFTGIPATVREFRVSYHHLSINTNGYVKVYLGGGSLDTSSNYVGVRGYNGSGSGNGASPSTSYQGFQMTDYTGEAKTYSGTFTCSKIDGNYWEINWHQHEVNSASQGFFTGYINLGGTLDRVDMSPSTGTWDNGTIAITYIY